MRHLVLVPPAAISLLLGWYFGSGTPELKANDGVAKNVSSAAAAPPGGCDNFCRNRRWMYFLNTGVNDYREFTFPDCFGCTQAAGQCRPTATDQVIAKPDCITDTSTRNPFWNIQNAVLECPVAVNG